MSSGEKVLLRLILWQYFASTDGEFPKLLLLDEPDAHLHPTMTQDFLSTIQDIIINKMGSKVIMTTHSPTTIALAPEESIYWMDRDGIRLQKRGKSDVLRELSEGLILVSENTCNVVVEDKDDVKFYNSIRDQLIHLKLIAPTPYLKFSPSSKANATGGRDVAIQDAKKVRAFMGKKALVALVDMDYEAPQETPFFTNRYSIENYLYDPLIIHCWRVDNGKKTNTKLATAKLKGRVADLLSLETRQLQNIIDHYCDQIEKFISFDECVIKNPKTTQKVQISDTITLSYPRWFLYMKGKDIGKAYKDVYSDHPSFQPLFSLIGNIPSLWPEFIDTFKRIQSSP
jgi:energy-coupling factor transporter ATP-binding protein EcfA2